MGDSRRRTCKLCGERDQVTGELSWTGLCSACGDKRRRENFDSLHNLSGVPFQIWRRKHAAAVGAVLIEDLPENLARAVLDYLTSAAQEPNVA